MRRREFLGVIGGAASWPLAAHAQQTAMPVVGFLRSAALAEVPHFATAFRHGLKETGFVEGQNVAVEYHSADDHHDRLVTLAANLVRRPVDVIVANHNAALAAKAVTTSVPIVFSTGSDPVRDGLVASLNRPGGNITGVVNFQQRTRWKAAGNAAQTRARGNNNWRARVSRRGEYRGRAEGRASGGAGD